MQTGMKICGALAVIATAAAIVILLMDWQAAQGTGFHATSAGELWHRIDAASLNLTQAVTERYVSPALWSGVILPLLLAPAWAVALGKAGFFALIALILHRLSRARETGQPNQPRTG